MFDRSARVGFIGAGRVGSALAMGMSRAGYSVAAVASRSPAAAHHLAARLPEAPPDTIGVSRAEAVVDACDVVFLTVPDDAIAPVAAALPWRPGQGAVHCSGALSLQALAAAAGRGAFVGGLHPLQTFASRERGAELLAGSTFALEAEGPLAAWLEEVARRLGGRVVALAPEYRALYHAAAVLSCGYIATLLDAACCLWEAMGFSERQALEALLPLARATLANAAEAGPRASATGPIVRGDVGTLRRHGEALALHAPEAAGVYRQMGRAMVEMAVRGGALGAEQAARLQQALDASEREVVASDQQVGRTRGAP